MSMRRNTCVPNTERLQDPVRNRRTRRLSSESGNAIVEFALSLPLMLLVLTAIWAFGNVYTQMTSLTQATAQAAQVLQTDRTSADPCADTFNAITGFAPTLVSTKITMTITVGATKMTKNSCPGQVMTSGETVAVQSSYPYTLTIAGMNVATGTMNTGTISEIEY